MNREQRRILRHASNLLLTDAALTRESCELNGKLWACGDCTLSDGKCQAQHDHDARVKAAGQLKTIASTTRRAP